jgi:transposase
MVITIYMTNIFKKSISYIIKKLQKYTDDSKEVVNTNENDKEIKINNDNLNNTINQSNKVAQNDQTNEQNKILNDSQSISYNTTNLQENKQILKNEYETKQEPKIYTVEELKNKINTIWDIIKIKENTQAEHLIKIIPSDQWIDMEEIKQRIKLEFNIEYKNEKSLYPYLKTLTDINLIKLNNTGKKRSWKKNIIIIE